MGRPISPRVIAALAAASLAGALAIQATTGETVASFVDDTFATGKFSADKWNMQGDDGSGWKDNLNMEGKPAATLTLSPTTVTPTSYSYSFFDLRLQHPSSVGATVNMSPGTVVDAFSNSGPVIDQSARNTLANRFRLRVVRVGSGTTCNLAAFDNASSSSFLVGGPSSRPGPLTPPVALTPPFTLPAASEAADGLAVRLCFEFGVNNDTNANGSTIAMRWTFTGTSTS